MGHIPAEVVEATWRRIGAFDRASISALQAKSGRFQPELTGFVLGFTSELRAGALGLALYVMVVVYEMFRVHQVKMRKARERVVIRQWEAARDRVEDLREAGIGRAELGQAEVETTEPFVMRYVLEAFTERADDDPIDVSDGELWHIVTVLMTVVETLHEMAGAERRSV